jgi:hypothetical protein
LSLLSLSSSSTTESSSPLPSQIEETTTTTLLLQYLDSVENELEACAICSDDVFLESLTCQVRNELIDTKMMDNDGRMNVQLQQVGHHHRQDDNDSDMLLLLMDTDVQEIENFVLEEMELFQDQWQQHYDLIEHTRNVLVQQLQSQLQLQLPISLNKEVSGDDSLEDAVLAYYHWRNRNLFHDEGININNHSPRWKVLADQALDLRDKQHGLGPGHFWGAQGEYYCIVLYCIVRIMCDGSRIVYYRGPTRSSYQHLTVHRVFQFCLTPISFSPLLPSYS